MVSSPRSMNNLKQILLLVYVPNNIMSKFTRHKLIELKGETDKFMSQL